jgi:hypothetical protein
MPKIYSEEDITWSSIEKYVPYNKVRWCVRKDGIPVYNFFNEKDERIYINDYIDKMVK